MRLSYSQNKALFLQGWEFLLPRWRAERKWEPSRVYIFYPDNSYFYPALREGLKDEK